MLFTKTMKLRIYPSNEQVQQLQRLTEVYCQACNFVSAYIFEHDFELNSAKINKALYHKIRGTFGLKAQLTQSVFRTVTARYKTVKEQFFQNPYKFKDEYTGKHYTVYKDLHWLRKPLNFHRPQADLVRSRDYCFLQKGRMLSLNTLGNRIEVGYEDECFHDYFDGTWTFGTGKIVGLKGKWYFHLPVSRDIEEFNVANVKHVVGIDRGLRFLTAVYDEQGKCSFDRGGEILRKRAEFVKTRKNLQKKGTRSAKRRLRILSGRENRWMSDINHQISKTLVQKYGPDTVFAIEDLTGVSFEESNLQGTKKQNYEKRSWAFYQLEQFLTYKAAENRSAVIKVDPWCTSQRCPKCGAVRKEQRHHHEHEYVCSCGYRANDDLTGARNIQMLGTLWVSGNEKPSIKKLAVSE